MNGNGLINDEVIAVIAAAIALVNTRPGYKLVVRSMRRLPLASPPWNAAGRLERLGKRLGAR